MNLRVALALVLFFVALPLLLRVYAAWWYFTRGASVCETFIPIS
jgi:hypothetical protein